MSGTFGAGAERGLGLAGARGEATGELTISFYFNIDLDGRRKAGVGLHGAGDSDGRGDDLDGREKGPGIWCIGKLLVFD
jgi:hypothetical protein